MPPSQPTPGPRREEAAPLLPRVFWPGLTNLVFPPPTELNYPEVPISQPADHTEAQTLPKVSFSTPGPPGASEAVLLKNARAALPGAGQEREGRKEGGKEGGSAEKQWAVKQGTWGSVGGDTGRSPCQLVGREKNRKVVGTGN